MNNLQRVANGLLGQLPDLGSAVSLTDGKKFALGIRAELGKYAYGLHQAPELLFDAFRRGAKSLRVYGNYLVHAGTVSSWEVVGTPMFLFLDGKGSTNVDRLFTPISLVKLGNHPQDIAPGSHKMANILYGNESGLSETIPNFQQLMETRKFHSHLIFAGPMLKITPSSFVGKVSTVSRGEVVEDDSYSGHCSLRLPAEFFTDLGKQNTFNYYGMLPATPRAYIYACLCYLQHPGEETFLVQAYFRTLVCGPELLSLVRAHFLRHIITCHANFPNEFNLDHLKFGFICKLGYFPEDVVVTRESVGVRGSNLIVVNIPRFTVDPGSWEPIV
ncbi:assembly/DNA maturation protein [Cricetid gammaherpesvirus 2]|uniref:Assembly/DNA maturation protein n=1 Tax=Cricetid gammaherpesvirus 2 TaxID=1605972 RepID=E9M5P5_9GAMA|nr:assembly/DNA maturation protein [Cricetid gammaherpesvirus 2]ADW24403.1 assembly/DNA maturation protein [Cricetid gammaherpesvirus 2]ADW24485.1 assembly/DNA maturation protein [Cricetid gammaherpesvirus 2]